MPGPDRARSVGRKAWALSISVGRYVATASRSSRSSVRTTSREEGTTASVVSVLADMSSMWHSQSDSVAGATGSADPEQQEGSTGASGTGAQQQDCSPRLPHGDAAPVVVCKQMTPSARRMDRYVRICLVESTPEHLKSKSHTGFR